MVGVKHMGRGSGGLVLHIHLHRGHVRQDGAVCYIYICIHTDDGVRWDYGPGDAGKRALPAAPPASRPLVVCGDFVVMYIHSFVWYHDTLFLLLLLLLLIYI